MLIAVTCRVQTARHAGNCDERLTSQRQRWRRARQSHHGSCSRWPLTKDRTTGTSTCRTWNLLTTTSSAPPTTWLAPNEVHMNRLSRLPLTIFEHHYARGHQASPATICNTASSPPTTNGVRMGLLVNNTPSLSPARNAAIQCSPTHSNKFLYTPSMAGYGSTTPPLPFARVSNPAPTPRFSRRRYRSTG